MKLLFLACLLGAVFAIGKYNYLMIILDFQLI